MRTPERALVTAALDAAYSPQEVLRNIIHMRLQSLCARKHPDWGFNIVMHEFSQPTPAMARVIEEGMRPIYERVLKAVGEILGLPPEHETTRLCNNSIIGQVLFYTFSRPVLSCLQPDLRLTPERLERIADHITEFSLASLNEMARQKNKPAKEISKVAIPGDAPAFPATLIIRGAGLAYRGEKEVPEYTPMSDVQASTETSAVERTQIAAQPPAATSETPAAAEDRPPRGKVVRIVTIVAVVMGLLFIWKVFFASPSLPASIVALSGRIEGDDSAVAPKTSGKTLEITVREGDSVTAGQVIARLDDTQIRAQEQAARAALLDAQAKALSATEQIHVLQEQLHENQLQTGQSKTDAAGRVRQAQADLTASEADLAQQQATLKLAEFNRDAYMKLAKTGAVSEQQGLQAEAAADQQQAAVLAAQRRVESARGAVTTAQAMLDNPKIRDAQVAGTERQIKR
jgi:biotin carboxyl carrier protein